MTAAAPAAAASVQYALDERGEAEVDHALDRRHVDDGGRRRDGRDACSGGQADGSERRRETPGEGSSAAQSVAR